MNPETVHAGWLLVGAGFITLGATVLLVARGPREHNCPGCRTLSAFDEQLEREASFAAHTDAALRLLPPANVVQLPKQREAGRWS